VKAAIFSTGDELIIGKTLDTNAYWLINQLTELNVDVVCQIDVGDVKSEIIWGLQSTTSQAELVVMTGGLGPTDDDLTRFAIADILGVELRLHEPSLRYIENFFAARNRPMNERNRIQAMMPEGAEVLDNPNGTAPGIKVIIGTSTVFCLPGVPREMKAMFDLYIKPWVLERTPQTNFFRKIHCIGMGESDLVHKIDDLVRETKNVIFGTTANEGIISIGLAGKDKSALDTLDRAIQFRLGKIIFGFDGQTLPEAIGLLLRQRNQTLATAESCTGGLIGKMLTDTPGSSDYYLGGLISYSNTLKQNLLSVPEALLITHGAVSAPVAEAMAQGALEKTSSDWAVSVTGIAGPGGETPTKPVGLVYIALAGKNGMRQVKEFRFGSPGREAVRFRAAISALDLLRHALID
jgi:nicotinamide-nucleotide amidase